MPSSRSRRSDRQTGETDSPPAVCRITARRLKRSPSHRRSNRPACGFILAHGLSRRGTSLCVHRNISCFSIDFPVLNLPQIISSYLRGCVLAVCLSASKFSQRFVGLVSEMFREIHSEPDSMGYFRRMFRGVFKARFDCDYCGFS